MVSPQETSKQQSIQGNPVQTCFSLYLLQAVFYYSPRNRSNIFPLSPLPIKNIWRIHYLYVHIPARGKIFFFTSCCGKTGTKHVLPSSLVSIPNWHIHSGTSASYLKCFLKASLLPHHLQVQCLPQLLLLRTSYKEPVFHSRKPTTSCISGYQSIKSKLDLHDRASRSGVYPQTMTNWFFWLCWCQGKHIAMINNLSDK